MRPGKTKGTIKGIHKLVVFIRRSNALEVQDWDREDRDAEEERRDESIY